MYIHLLTKLSQWCHVVHYFQPIMMQENKSEESIAISVTIVLALSMFTRIRQRCEFDVQTPRNTKLKSESLTSI